MGLMDILNGMQNGPRGQRQPEKKGMSPVTMALLGLLAYKAYQHMSGSGERKAAPSPRPGENEGGGLGGLLNNLGGMLGPAGGALAGGAAGGVLTDGLNDLLRRFEQQGMGRAMQSWVNTGPNEEITPQQLGQAIGDERLDALARQTGLSREELLEELSAQLPEFIDKLTPQGRIPDEREAAQLMRS